MSKKLNGICTIYEDNDYYFGMYNLMSCLGIIFTILFGWATIDLAFDIGFNFLSILFMCMFIIFLCGTSRYMFKKYSKCKMKKEHTLKIKNEGKKTSGEVINLRRFYRRTKDKYLTEGVVKYLDDNVDEQIIFTPMIRVFNRVKVVKKNIKELENCSQEEIKLYIQKLKKEHENIRDGNLNEVEFLRNFNGRIECNVYEKDGEIIVDDFLFTDVECVDFFTK